VITNNNNNINNNLQAGNQAVMWTRHTKCIKTWQNCQFSDY